MSCDTEGIFSNFFLKDANTSYARLSRYINMWRLYLKIHKGKRQYVIQNLFCIWGHTIKLLFWTIFLLIFSTS